MNTTNNNHNHQDARTASSPASPSASATSQEPSEHPRATATDTLWTLDKMKKDRFTPLHDTSLYLNQTNSTLPFTKVKEANHSAYMEEWLPDIKTPAST